MPQDMGVHIATRFTTLWGGCGVAISALLSLVISLPVVTVDGVTALAWYMVPTVPSAVVSCGAMFFLAAAVYRLGFGTRGEGGLVGDSRIGRIAVLVFVAATVANSLARSLFIVWSAPVRFESVVGGYVGAGIGVVALAAMIAAVTVAVRRRMLNRGLRSGLVIVTAWTLVIQAIP